MSPNTPQNAPTQYITASNGTKFAYRHVGPALNTSTPLVMHIHFRGNMDYWDPLLLSTLASTRPVILFDQAGVGRSSGTVPTTMQGWADDLISFVDALGLKSIDLLGFSMGGIAVQYVALTRPNLVRRLILAGTTASAPLDYEKVKGLVSPREDADLAPTMKLMQAESVEEGKAGLKSGLFYDDEAGRAAFDAYWARVEERKVAGEELILKPLNAEQAGRQMAATIAHATPSEVGSFDRLHELKMPVLVANGDDDIIIASSRSWELYRLIENAQLIMYPKSGHGFLWQYAEMFGRQINDFLDSKQI